MNQVPNASTNPRSRGLPSDLMGTPTWELLVRLCRKNLELYPEVLAVQATIEIRHSRTSP